MTLNLDVDTSFSNRSLLYFIIATMLHFSQKVTVAEGACRDIPGLRLKVILCPDVDRRIPGVAHAPTWWMDS
jgi:hypothetical protein